MLPGGIQTYLNSECREGPEDAHVPSHVLVCILPIVPQWNIFQLVFKILASPLIDHICSAKKFDFSLVTDVGIYIQQMDGEKNVRYCKNLVFLFSMFSYFYLFETSSSKNCFIDIGNMLYCFFEVCWFGVLQTSIYFILSCLFCFWAGSIGLGVC